MAESIPPSEEIKYQTDPDLSFNETVYDAETIVYNSQFKHMILPSHRLKKAAHTLGSLSYDSLVIAGYAVLCIPNDKTMIEKMIE